MTPIGSVVFSDFLSLRPVPGIKTLKPVSTMVVSHREDLCKAGSRVGFTQFCLFLLSSFTTVWKNWNKT